jgi:hypothetical protein
VPFSNESFSKLKSSFFLMQKKIRFLNPKKLLCGFLKSGSHNSTDIETHEYGKGATCQRVPLPDQTTFKNSSQSG